MSGPDRFYWTVLHAVCFGVVLPALGAGKEWRHVTPRLRPAARPLQRKDAAALLARICSGRLEKNPRYGPGFGCTVRRLGKDFDFGDSFQAEVVTFGHFRSNVSDDALVSGWSLEHHPELWTGSLLLTREQDGWHPVWYKSSVITHSCEKAPLPDGREILICEEEDGGMGHRLHYLFWVDARKPTDARRRVLVEADTFLSMCDEMQRQVIERIAWEERGSQRTLAVSFLDGKKRLSESEQDSCANSEKVRPPRLRRRYRRFVLTDEGIRDVSRVRSTAIAP